MTAYLGLADYLLIANFNRIGLADSALVAPQAGFGEVEAYPDFATRAAVLCWHLVKNHPLPDGNKRCAFLATSSSWSATGERGFQRPVIRMRPTASSAPSRVAT